MKRILLVICMGMVCAKFSVVDAHPEMRFDQKVKNPYLDVPELSDGIGLISRQQEKLIGEKVLRQVRQQLPLVRDIWLEEEVGKIFESIYGQTSLGEPIATVIVQDQQINAFAVPGGLFAINTGLITSAKNIDEIAGVVAHEIAHVTQRHYSRSKEAFKGQGLLSLAGLLAGIVIASQSSDASAGAAVMLGSQAALIDKQLTYSRNQEREADRVGMQYMSIAGYDPNSMADFFEVMHRSTSRLSYLPDFWFTHPLTTERTSEARLRARQYPAKAQTNFTNESFELMRWRAVVLGKHSNVNQLKSNTVKSVGASLALATLYIEQSQYNDAKIILDRIQPSEQQKSLYYLVLADWYKAQNKYSEALGVVLPYYLIAPENKAYAFKVAELYVLNTQIPEATKLLKQLSSIYARDLLVWQLLQQVEFLKNTPFKHINVLRYKAEYHFWNGQEEEAVKSLLHAKRLMQSKNNEFLNAKILSRLQEMQEIYQLKI